VVASGRAFGSVSNRAAGPMLLDGILDHNRGFVRGRNAQPLPSPEILRLAVIACYDPRLDTLLPEALGIEPEKAFFLRAAGNVVRPDGDPLRSLALAVFLFGVTEVLVVGHTSCRMAAFATAPFIEAFRARGVAREGFGPRDLRDWAGAIPDPRRGVQSSVAAISAAPFLPADLSVGGLLLDDTTGALEVVVGPDAARTEAPAAAGVPADRPEPPPPPTPALPEPLGPTQAPPDLSREMEAIRSFVSALETTAAWRGELAQLRTALYKQRSPLARLTLIEGFLRRSAVNARGVHGAFERLKSETVSAGRALDIERLIDLFRGESKRAR
jgi:carbonic anhydrase